MIRVFKWPRRKCCLCNFICKWSDFLVFSDKDDKLKVPSQKSFNVDNSVEIKEPTLYSKRSRVIPVLWLSFVREWGGGGGVRLDTPAVKLHGHRTREHTGKLTVRREDLSLTEEIVSSVNILLKTWLKWIPCIRQQRPQYERQSKIRCPTETTR